MARVCVIGSSNLDFTVSVPRLPGVGETVSGGTLVTSPGGKGANQAVAARRLGADVAVSPEQAGPQVWGGSDGLGCEVSVECCGHDTAVDLALRAARPGARVLLVGIPDDDRTGLTAGLVRHKGLTLIAVRRMKEMYERAIPLVARGAVDVRAVTDSTFPLRRSVEAFESACERSGLKVVVEPNR